MSETPSLKAKVQREDGALSVYLSEYEQLFEENRMCIRWQHEIVYLTLALVSAAVLLIRGLEEPLLSLAVLSLPIAILILGFVLLALQARVAQIASYTHSVLRPRLETRIGAQALGWQQFLYEGKPKAVWAIAWMPIILYYGPVLALFVISSVVPIALYCSQVAALAPWQMAFVMFDAILLAGFCAVAMSLSVVRIRKSLWGSE